MSDCVLGVDIGTSSVKAVLFDTEGRRIASGEHAHKTQHPAAGWAEQNALDWWHGFVEAVREARDAAGTRAGDIAGIGISCQAPTMLPVDSGMEPLRPAMIWMDRRSDAECRLLRERLGEERITAITANRIDPFYVLPKLVWYAEHEPALFKKTAKLLQPNGFVAYRLTGVLSIDRAHASITQLYDVSAQTWSQEILTELSIAPDLLPDVYDGDAVIGAVTAAAAQETGLAEGTPVIAGTVDGAAAAVEAGVVGEGEAVDMTGTSTVLLVSTASLSKNKNLTNMSHALSGKQLVLGAMSSTGGALSWFRDILSPDPRDSDKADGYQLLDQLAQQEQPTPSSVLFMPYLAGERSPIWDSDARGAFIGMDFNTSRGTLVRSVLEGAAYALRHNVEEIRRSGIELHRMRAIGGGAKSDLWLRIKASVLNMELELPETSLGAPLGDAILVYGALTGQPDYDAMLKRIIRVKRRVAPVQEWVERYDELYRHYRFAYEQLKPLYRGLAENHAPDGASDADSIAAGKE